MIGTTVPLTYRLYAVSDSKSPCSDPDACFFAFVIGSFASRAPRR
jgi:hypothetical protein